MRKIAIVSFLLFLATGPLFSWGMSLGTEVECSPTLFTLSDTSSFIPVLSIGATSIFQLDNLRLSFASFLRKGTEYHSFHRFSTLSEVATVSICSGMGYMLSKTAFVDLSLCLSLFSIGTQQYRTRAISPSSRITFGKVIKGNDYTPDFVIMVPAEITFGKTARSLALGLGAGLFFSIDKEEQDK